MMSTDDSSSCSSSSSCSTCSSSTCSSSTEHDFHSMTTVDPFLTDSDESVDNQIRPMNLIEHVYQEKLTDLQNLESQLEDGTHIDYVQQLRKLEDLQRNELKRNKIQKQYLLATIEKEYDKECRLAKREFYDRRKELKETLIVELKEKRKAIEQDFTKLVQDFFDRGEPNMTRKLRRRLNDTVIPSPEERCLSPFPILNINYSLHEHEIEQDVKAIKKSLAFISSTSTSVSTTEKKKDTIYPSSIRKPSYLQSSNPSGYLNPKIVDGKLLFEKRWFHRGQPIYVEGKSVQTFSGIIYAISGEKIWVKKTWDNSKYCINLSELSRGEMSIKRRAEI